jgi:hypothetical protein
LTVGDKEADRATRNAFDVAEVAALRLLDIKPTTIAGVIALLGHYADARGADGGELVSEAMEKNLSAPRLASCWHATLPKCWSIWRREQR